jgi:hypothetical protein
VFIHFNVDTISEVTYRDMLQKCDRNGNQALTWENTVVIYFKALCQPRKTEEIHCKYETETTTNPTETLTADTQMEVQSVITTETFQARSTMENAFY